MMSGSSSDKPPDEQRTRVGGVPVYVVNKKSKTHSLRLIKGPGAPKDYPLDTEEAIVGRATEVHISVDSQSISRRHAALRRDGDEIVCSDLGSSNGVYVNGERVQSVALKDGDSVQIGDALFFYQVG